MPTLVGSGTQTATVTTEHTLDTETTNGVFVLVVDTAAMLSGATPDELELRIYYTCLTSGTERLAYAVAGDVNRGLFFRGAGPLPFGTQIRPVRELVEFLLGAPQPA